MFQPLNSRIVPSLYWKQFLGPHLVTVLFVSSSIFVILLFSAHSMPAVSATPTPFPATLYLASPSKVAQSDLSAPLIGRNIASKAFISLAFRTGTHRYLSIAADDSHEPSPRDRQSTVRNYGRASAAGKACR
jgi:hypothetical protein